MKLVFSCLLALLLPALGKAASFTYTPSPSPTLNNLDHHLAYTWRINNINLGGATISGASLTFTNIWNWDNNPNMLFLHLLDTAKYSGVSTFVDASGAPVPSNQIRDNFAAPWVAFNPLVANGTANTFLTSKSFTMSAATFTYNFTAAQLAALQAYIANGNNIAFGLDPDCHYFNQGVRFTFTVPDAGNTVALLGLALVSIALIRRKLLLAEQTKVRVNRINR